MRIFRGCGLFNGLLMWGMVGLSLSSDGQEIFPEALPQVNWQQAGVSDSIPTYDRVINFVDAGGDKTGMIAGNAILDQLLQEYSGTESVIYFPEGDYLFTAPVVIQDQIVLRGDGAGRTKLRFDLNRRIQNAISISGTMSNELYPIHGNLIQREHHVQISNLDFPLHDKIWVYLQFNDSLLMTSPWAYRSAGGLYELTSLGGEQFESSEAFRMNVTSDDDPQVRLMSPVSGVGLECLSIFRADATPQQTSNIVFDAAVNCWVVGVESRKCNFAHVDIRRSANLTVRGNYFHEAHAYGGGGQGYGVVLQYGSSMCLVENNVFRKLRHAMLLQAGAQANVLAYNYSTEPFWSQSSLPTDAAGDMVLHGNYPYLNLFEGNIAQNIVIDASHGKNGPHNYFLRNRAELYGIVMSQGSGTDSTHFIGNEVISNMFLQGFYSLIGRGNFEYGNRVRGMIRPQGTVGDFPVSLYLEQSPGFWVSDKWPHIGIDNLQLSAINPAKTRYSQSTFTDCRTNPVMSGSSIASHLTQLPVKIYPNPATDLIFTDQILPDQTIPLIYTTDGRLVSSGTSLYENGAIDISSLPSGAYVLILTDQKRFFRRAVFVKQ